MPRTDSAAAGAADDESRTELVDPIAQAVDQAMGASQDEPDGDDAAEDSVSEPAGDTSAADESTDEGEEPEDEDSEADEGSDPEPETEPSKDKKDESAQTPYYTEDELETLDLFELEMERVPPELRRRFRIAQAKITRKYQELAEERRASVQPPSPEGTSKTEKQLSDEELYDLSQEGPEGFSKALQIAMRQMLPEAFKSTVGVDPERVKQTFERSSNAELIHQAISIAQEDFEELDDPAFRNEVGAILKSSKRLQTVVQSEDPMIAATAIAEAAERARSARAAAKQKADSVAKKAREDQKQKESQQRLKKNAEERGSVAARSTARTPAPVKGKVLTVEEAVETELSSGRYQKIH